MMQFWIRLNGFVGHYVWLAATYRQRKRNAASLEAQLSAERRRMWREQKVGRIPAHVDLLSKDLSFLRVMMMGNEPVVLNRRYPKPTQRPGCRPPISLYC